MILVNACGQYVSRELKQAAVYLFVVVQYYNKQDTKNRLESIVSKYIPDDKCIHWMQILLVCTVVCA